MMDTEDGNGDHMLPLNLSWLQAADAEALALGESSTG
jgi:hypothetical protein